MAERTDSVSSTLTGEGDNFNASYNATILAGEQEYETQFLGFAPKSFCDGLYNAVIDYTWEYFKASQEYMKSEFAEKIKEGELQKASEVFLSAISKTIDKAFDKFETFILTSLMYIPDHVVLPGDTVQQQYKDFTKEEEQMLDDDIERLKDRIKAVKYLNASLRQEFNQIDAVQQEYNQFLDLLRAMNKTVRESGVSDVRESLNFVVGKSNKIIDILTQMKSPIGSTQRSLPDSCDLEKLSKKLQSDPDHGDTDD